MTTQETPQHSITHDSIYYVTVFFFVLLTTVLPALLGQPRFLPIIQTLALTTFVAVPLRHRNVSGALQVMLIWLPIQFVVMALLTRVFPGQLEAAFTNGFAYRGAITAWFYGGAQHPVGLAAAPVARLVEVLAVIIGSAATAGLVGAWSLVRLLNQSAYGVGVLLATLEHPLHLLLVIPYWTLVRAAGYALVIVLCAMPLLTSQWSPAYYWRNHRRLVISAFVLLLLGLLIETFLPGLLARPSRS